MTDQFLRKEFPFLREHLVQSLNVLMLTLSFKKSLDVCSMGFKSGVWAGQFIRVISSRYINSSISRAGYTTAYRPYEDEASTNIISRQTHIRKVHLLEIKIFSYDMSIEDMELLATIRHNFVPDKYVMTTVIVPFPDGIQLKIFYHLSP
ncbi:hypothetical protein AVEN_53358-1 [Araneus ventricosus]|uniref:Uncharacterized protein n=1 Tax=Araneus ventricosus TaxID=182803 RepID=A0A4Y2ACG5_ARAVE|nr:hypothetical protein AVEN_53358-1 [Araneus ventricosus]